MNKLLSLLLFFLITCSLAAQDLPWETYGDQTNPALLFLHGGPGYNSVSFESTTAEELAAEGFFVVSYDRRGEGRNSALEASYTFDQTFDDLNQLYTNLNLEKASLIGHSFGGVVASLFAHKHPEKIKSLILVSTPISMQESLKNIISKAKVIYTEKGDNINLGYISMLENMDSTSLEYSSYSFMHAMSNGFYSTKKPNENAMRLYKRFATDSLLQKYASKMKPKAPQKFWENEQYTTLTLHQTITDLKNRGMKIYGIYGQEDGLFSIKQISDLKNTIGKRHVKYLEDCSHSVFIDQQAEFLKLVKAWSK